MRPLPTSLEFQQIARRVIWFEDPVKALSDPIRFVAYAMSHAVHTDMKIIREHVTDDEMARCWKTLRQASLTLARGRTGM